MITAAIVLYVIFALIKGVLWPLELLGGKGGVLGYLLLIIWISLIIGGSAS